jgi:hypothetical protein
MVIFKKYYQQIYVEKIPHELLDHLNIGSYYGHFQSIDDIDYCTALIESTLSLNLLS